MSSSGDITVSVTSEEVRRKQEVDSKGRPDHWVDDKPSGFQNPWLSFRKHTLRDFYTVVTTRGPSIPKLLDTMLPVRTPTWGISATDSTESSDAKKQIKATWLGHACFLVELPARTYPNMPPPSRGPRILFDPVFSNRCSPSQWVGPKRYTKAPCKIEEIPEVDAIVISHNHYDHLDTHTIRTLMQRTRPPHIFAPLGNGPYFRSLGLPDDKVHLLDWWEARRVEVAVAAAPSTSAGAVGETAPSARARFDVTCTPAQHFTNRGLHDRFKTLWASWVVEDAPAPPDSAGAGAEQEATKVIFGGDTGYRAVLDGQDEATVPTCPAFKEIGARFGGFDLAIIPIGAYLPREFMSPIHCAPQDSVCVFRDLRAKRALGSHWGTWILTSEEVLEPPRRLAEECEKAGIEKGLFDVCEIGETRFF